MNRLLALAAAAALSLPGLARAATFNIDGAHSTVGFKVRHLVVSTVSGKFGKFSGTIDFDAAKPEALKIDATIDATSIDTGNADRDGHLKSPDFFNVEQFPTLTFKSKKAVKKGGKLKVTGDLTLHGVTKEVVLDVAGLGKQVTDPWGNTKIGAEGTTVIDRQDFKLNWSNKTKTGEAVVSDKVTIVLEIEANLAN